MAVHPLFEGFRDALMAGVRGGQELCCALATVQRVLPSEVATSGAFPCYRYVNRLSGEETVSPHLGRLVEQWMRALDCATQLDVELRRDRQLPEHAEVEVQDG